MMDQNKKVLKCYQNKMKNKEFKGDFIINFTRYYFDYIIKLEDFGTGSILIDGNLHENISIYDISYKTFVDSKPLPWGFGKMDEFNRIYNGTRYILLTGSEKHNAIYDRIRYPISLKSSITYIFSHYYVKSWFLCFLWLVLMILMNKHWISVML